MWKYNEHIAIFCGLLPGVAVALALTGCGGTSGGVAAGGSTAQASGPVTAYGASGTGGVPAEPGQSVSVEPTRPPPPQPQGPPGQALPRLDMPTAPIGISVDPGFGENGIASMVQCASISYDSSLPSSSVPPGMGVTIDPVLAAAGIFTISDSRCDNGDAPACTAGGFVLTASDSTCAVRLEATGRSARSTTLSARGSLRCPAGLEARCADFVRTVNDIEPRGGSRVTVTQPDESTPAPSPTGT